MLGQSVPSRLFTPITFSYYRANPFARRVNSD